MLVMRILPEVRHCGEAYIWRWRSLLVVTLPNSHSRILLSVTHVNHIFLCNASRHLALRKSQSLVVEMQTLHGHSKLSGRSGLGPVTFLQTKHAHLHLELTIHVEF